MATAQGQSKLPYRGGPLHGIAGRVIAQDGAEDASEEPHVAEDGLVEEVGVRREVCRSRHAPLASGTGRPMRCHASGRC